MKPLILIGSGGFAGVIIDAIRQAESHRVIGLIDDFVPKDQRQHGIPCLGGMDALYQWRHEDLFIAVGSCKDRSGLVSRIVTFAPRFISIKHPSAVVADTAHIGTGCYIGAGAYVGNNARIGHLTIVNSNATVDHDCTLGDFSHVSVGATVGSYARIGNRVTIGIGATIAKGVVIDSDSQVKGGEVVFL